MTTTITRENIDQLLDTGQLEIAMMSGKYWSIRRNGATKTWKRSPRRVRIPFKYGMYGYGAIDDDCDKDGVFSFSYIRVRETKE